MGFDLFVWPIDGPISYAEATAHLDRMLDEDPTGPTDERLAAFMHGLRARFPEAFPDFESMEEEWQPAVGQVIFEMNDETSHVFLGIPFSSVARVGRAAQELAGIHDLLVLDPQSEAVYLPPVFGGAEVDWGVDPTPDEIAAQQAEWMAESLALADTAGPQDEAAISLDLLRSIASSGGEMWSPMGYQLTEETMLESLTDPTRTPSSLQTPEHRDRLIADLASPKRGPRSMALTQLAGWDPDPQVAAALRPLLRSDDDFVRWEAAAGIARQGATDALDDMLDVVRRASPGEGGSIGGMLLPVRYALELAQRVGPESESRVRVMARDWRGPTPAKVPFHEREWIDELDAMLSEP